MSTPHSPFFSICVPQYNRTSFLIEALRALATQTFTDFEVCISDDCSTDGRQYELVEELKALELQYVYYRQPQNLRYDANLRAAIGLASGRYCLLMGNDDCLSSPDVLQRLFENLIDHPETGVAVANYLNGGDGTISRRVRSKRLSAGTPELAVARFRNFSFVSGVLLRRERAVAHATPVWDGAEMYQMYLGSRIIAEGYALLELDEVMVIHDLPVAGETVDSYAARSRVWPCPIQERPIPLVRMGALVCDAILPFRKGESSAWVVKVFLQILLFTYPFWIVEYRRVQSWRFSCGICLGMRPKRQLQGVAVSFWQRLLLNLTYAAVTCAGLIMPIKAFSRLRPKFYSFAKAALQRS